MKLIKNLSIKYKAYLLVAIGVVTAILLLVTTNIGLSSIKSKLDELVLSTNVERYAYLTILEEKNYLLNANASVTNVTRASEAFENAKKDVETINTTLDKIDATSNNDGLLEKSKTARTGTNEYKELYYKGVDLLVNIRQETEKLEHEGDIATLQAQEYVLEKRKQLNEKLDATLVKKTNIATDIWKLTYVIRADEKRYMLNPDSIIFERMKSDFATMLANLDALKKMASDTQEQEKIVVFYNAAKSYEAAAYKWVDLNNNLMKVVLPKMKLLGDTVVKQAMDAAEEAQKNMIKKRNEIVTMLIFIAGIAVILGVLLGYSVANMIISQINGLADFIGTLVKNWDFSKRVDDKTDDEIGKLGKDFNQMLAALHVSIGETNAVMAAVAIGNFSERVKVSVSGDLDILKQNVNGSIDALEKTMSALTSVMKALRDGDFSKTVNSNAKGEFKVAIDNAMQSMKTIQIMFDDVAQVMGNAKNGNFTQRIQADGRGDLATLKDNINQSIGTTEKSLNDVLRVAEALASGDLTQTIDDNYVGAFASVKAGINATVENLKSLIGEIKNTSEVIAGASNEISAGNNNLSRRTQDQASSLEETATNMEELSTVVQQNTNNAKHANELAEGASTTAKKGVEVVNDVVKTMEMINQSSYKIVDIISVIDDIAFQTNILALNAAVEAARAGDSGKGFAVVAVEVRNLAQRAANAAGEIKRLISDSVENISAGSKQVENAGKTMEDIVGAIENVTLIMSEISTASIQQNSGISQVHQAISKMDSVTQQNATLVEEAAAAAESLSNQTRNLAKEMSNFKIDATKQRLDFQVF